VIRRYARVIAEEFHPDKIILFGSYAYGMPHDDSDVESVAPNLACRRVEVRASYDKKRKLCRG